MPKDEEFDFYEFYKLVTHLGTVLALKLFTELDGKCIGTGEIVCDELFNVEPSLQYLNEKEFEYKGATFKIRARKFA